MDTPPLPLDERQSNVAAVKLSRQQLPARPRLAPWLIVVELGDNRLQFRSAESVHTLAHPLLIETFRRIEKMIDGQHEVADIVAAAGPDILPSTAIFVLKLLRGSGMLQPGFGERPLDAKERSRWERQLGFLSHFVSDAESAQSNLRNARIGVIGSDDLRQAISRAMESVGVGDVVDLGEPAWCSEAAATLSDHDLIVACQESPAFDFFNGVNRACLQSGSRWLRVCISGGSAQLGPTIVPSQTACYTCLDLRQQAHQQDLEGYLAYKKKQEASAGNAIDLRSTGALLSAVAGQVALEAMRLITGFAPPATVGRFYELSAASPISIPHDVLKVPGCPSCGRRRTAADAWDQSFALGIQS